MPLFAKKLSKSAASDEPYEPEVRISRGTYGRLIFRRVISMSLFSLIALALLYFCFAATWIRVVPTISGSGLVPVKNVTYDGGNIPADAEILVDRENVQGTGLFSRIKQSFVPSDTAAKVRVISGPYGELQWAKPNILTVDGTPVGVPFPANEEGKSPIDEDEPFLKDAYVVECLSGACNEGEAFIVERNHVYGVALISSSNEE